MGGKNRVKNPSRQDTEAGGSQRWCQSKNKRPGQSAVKYEGSDFDAVTYWKLTIGQISVQCFTSMITFIPHNNHRRQPLLSSYYRWGKGESERSSSWWGVESWCKLSPSNPTTQAHSHSLPQAPSWCHLPPPTWQGASMLSPMQRMLLGAISLNL